MKNALRYAFIVLTAFFPALAYAQTRYDGSGLTTTPPVPAGLLTGTLEGRIISVTNFVVGLLGILATATIVAAGLYLLLGLGSDDSKDKAKKIIVNTAIGIAVIVLTDQIIEFVLFLVGDPGDTDTLTPFIQRLLTIINGLFITIGTIALVIAGLYLILGFGSDDNKETAKKIVIYTIAGIVLIILAQSIVAFVLFIVDGSVAGANAGLIAAIVAIIRAILNFLALMAVIVIIVAGLRLILGFGSDDSRESAKKMILYTIVGLLIILFALVIVSFVTDVVASRVGASTR